MVGNTGNFLFIVRCMKEMEGGCPLKFTNCVISDDGERMEILLKE